MRYARWLLTVQRADGSFSGPGMATPFAFDTGQIIRGLAAIAPYLPEAEAALQKACDWVIATATPAGRLALPESLSDGACPVGADMSTRLSTFLFCLLWLRLTMDLTVQFTKHFVQFQNSCVE